MARRPDRRHYCESVASGTEGRARQLFAAHAWAECRAVLTTADARGELGGPELALLGEVAFLTGADDQSAGAYARSYRWHHDRGELAAAARSASWCTFVLALSGEIARSAGWAARARQLVDDHELGGAAAGWVLADEAHRLMVTGRVADGLVVARAAEQLGGAAGDADVLVLSRLSIMHALVMQGDRVEAIRLADEIMVAVAAGETSAAVVGTTYCSAIGACLTVRDVGRAREWTDVLGRWCAARPELVPYRGQCRVHRAQMMTWGGDWLGAVAEATAAEQLLRGPAAGDAAYQLGEVHRLMGHLDAAAHHFRRANSLGRRPEPGLSRLRIAQGRADAAVTTIRRMCAEPCAPEDVAEMLDVLVEAQLALGEVDAARACAEELRHAAAGIDAPLVGGLAQRAEAATLLAAARPDTALAAANACLRMWAELDLPHGCAQVRVLMGRCLRALGDEPSAELEFDAARECFERLGAAPDVGVVERLIADCAPVGHRPGGLTEREVEVVRLVAAGHTNRVIARELRLSEKTVARHLSNIYTKLGVTSRAATTAYAYDHQLL